MSRHTHKKRLWKSTGVYAPMYSNGTVDPLAASARPWTRALRRGEAKRTKIDNSIVIYVNRYVAGSSVFALKHTKHRRKFFFF